MLWYFSKTAPLLLTKCVLTEFSRNLIYTWQPFFWQVAQSTTFQKNLSTGQTTFWEISLSILLCLVEQNTYSTIHNRKNLVHIHMNINGKKYNISLTAHARMIFYAAFFIKCDIDLAQPVTSIRSKFNVIWCLKKYARIFCSREVRQTPFGSYLMSDWSSLWHHEKLGSRVQAHYPMIYWLRAAGGPLSGQHRRGELRSKNLRERRVHDMEHFSHYWTFVKGNHHGYMDSFTKGK